jgi:putative membrane protein
MKLLLSLAKVLTLLFWALIISNLVHPFNQPFNALLQAAGAVLVLLHVAELCWFHKRLAACAKPWWARLHTFVFGGFYLYPLAALPAPLPGAVVLPALSPAPSAVTADNSAAPGASASDQSPQQELKLEGGNA